MIVKRSLTALLCLASVAALSSCGMFGSKSQPTTGAYVGGQEFDLYSNTWKPTQRVVTPSASQPNAMLAEKEAEAKRQNSLINRTSRAMNNTATAAGEAVKKPLKWIPGMKKEQPQEKVDPNYYPAPGPADSVPVPVP